MHNMFVLVKTSLSTANNIQQFYIKTTTENCNNTENYANYKYNTMSYQRLS